MKKNQISNPSSKIPLFTVALAAAGLIGGAQAQIHTAGNLLVNIDATGRVTSVKVLRPSPYPEFNEAARREALAEQFDPATRDGVPIPYTLSFTYHFRLKDSP